jgi:hypothetical protein
VEKSQFDPQLSKRKNRSFGPKTFSTGAVKNMTNTHPLPANFSATAIALALACALCSIQVAAQQVEIKDAPPLPETPKVSTFAPAADLAAQLQAYIKEIDATLESEQEYKDTEGKAGRCSSTLAVIALCLGLHDQDNEYKARAPAIIKAAQELAATKDYESAKKAFEAVKAAADGAAQAQADLKWEKVASLPDLMKQVPNINTKLKRNIKGAKFKTKARDTTGFTAVIAAIAQGSIPDISKAKNADEVKQWYEYMIDMRDAAGAANAAIHSMNEPAATAAMTKLAESCDRCHKVFHPAALLIEETDSEK